MHPVLELIARRRAAGTRDDGQTLALAIEGGGMRGAVSGGMVMALHRLGLREVFDHVYGASAGALNGAWLVSGDPEPGMSAWADTRAHRLYLRRSNPLRRRPVVDTRRLTHELYETHVRLDFERVVASDVPLHPLATDVETGEAVDLAPTVRDRASLKLALSASTALPLLAGPPVEIDGRRYVDAGVAESIPFRAAVAAGATHVLVLRSRRPQDSEEPGGLSLALTARLVARIGPRVRDGYVGRAARLAADDELLDRHAADPALEPALLSIRPPQSSPRVSRLERDAGVIRAGLEAGERAARDVLGPLVA